MKVCKCGERTWSGKAEWQAHQLGHYSSLHLGRVEHPTTRDTMAASNSGRRFWVKIRNNMQGKT